MTSYANYNNYNFNINAKTGMLNNQHTYHSSSLVIQRDYIQRDYTDEQLQYFVNKKGTIIPYSPPMPSSSFIYSFNPINIFITKIEPSMFGIIKVSGMCLDTNKKIESVDVLNSKDKIMFTELQKNLNLLEQINLL